MVNIKTKSNEDLVKHAHHEYLQKQKELLTRSISWNVEVDKSRGKTSTFEEAKAQFEKPKLPKQFSINNAVNYLKIYYGLKLSKKTIKETIKIKLHPIGKGEFGVRGREVGGMETYKIIGYDKYSLEDLDKLAIRIITRTQK